MKSQTPDWEDKMDESMFTRVLVNAIKMRPDQAIGNLNRLLEQDGLQLVVKTVKKVPVRPEPDYTA